MKRDLSSIINPWETFLSHITKWMKINCIYWILLLGTGIRCLYTWKNSQKLSSNVHEKIYRISINTFKYLTYLISLSKNIIRFQNSKVMQFGTIISQDVTKHCHLLEVNKLGRKVWTSLGFHWDGPRASQTGLQGLTVGDRPSGKGEETQVPWELWPCR